MEFFRILWRGMRDLYHSFTYFILISLAFWLCCLPMFFGFGFLGMSIVYWPLFLLSTILVPPALTTLFYLTDPRLVVSRPERSEAFGYFRSVFGRSWKIAFGTVIPLLIIGWNIAYFAGSGHSLELFIPLWIVMWVFLLILTLYCFSLAGTFESGLRNAYRGSMYVLVKYPFRTVSLSIFLLFFGYLATLSVLPMLIIGPAFFATIVNRFVFDALEVHVIDPDAPTDERTLERERGINLDRSLVDRIMRRGKE